MEMNKKLLAVIVLVVVIALTFVFYISSKNKIDLMNKTTGEDVSVIAKPTTESIVKYPSDEVAEKRNGRYIEYIGPETLQISGSKVILFFYANWCPTCIPTDKEFKVDENKLPNDITVIRVNYNDSDTDDNEKKLAKKYGITYQHTFVQIDNNGNEVVKWNGGAVDQLVLNIK